MKKDPEREAARWFAQAEAELKDARYLSDGGRYYLALFLAQQSAEKAVKAFPFFRNIDPIFTHSVTELLGTAEILDKDFHRMNYPAAELRGIKFSPLNPPKGDFNTLFFSFQAPLRGVGGVAFQSEKTTNSTPQQSCEEFFCLKEAKKLDVYYIPTRYPNGLPGDIPSQYYDDPEEAETAIGLSESVIELVRGKIGKS